MTALNAWSTRSIEPVYVVGIAATPFVAEHDAMLDELVFEAVYAALRECGLRKQDVELSVQASMDALDGRSISSGLITAAAGGYLGDSYRIEGDSGQAILAAAHAVTAGDVEVAIAVGVHNPETRSSDGDERRGFLGAISNLGFEPIFDRPIGLTAESVWAMHAAARLDGGMSFDDLAKHAAEEISRGTMRAQRSASAPGQVRDSTPISWPLTDLMLPAHSTGAVAVVLASPARAGRTIGRSARLTGFGHATGRYTWDGQWLSDPATTTRRAAVMAYSHAGVETPSEEIDFVELSAPTPALHPEYLDALGLTGVDTNASGGMRSNYPGLANGALRLLETVEQLESRGGGQAVSHSVDVETGIVAEDVTVLVVDAA